MAIRIASVSEDVFTKCLEVGIWGANNTSLNKWKIGDLLVIKVNGCYRALVKILGDSYLDDKGIWDNGLFWNRIPISPEVVLTDIQAGQITPQLTSMLKAQWGKNYGWIIQSKIPLPTNISEQILYMFDQYHK